MLLENPLPDVEWTVAGEANQTAKVSREHVLDIGICVGGNQIGVGRTFDPVKKQDAAHETHDF